MSAPIDWFKVTKKALTDWRIAWLSELLGCSFGDAFHLCCLVWCQLYERGGGYMPATEVDGVARRKGVAEAMVVVGLADATPEGFRIHGDGRAQKFAAYRESQKEKSIAAHEARYGNGPDKQLPAGMPAGMPGPCPDISYSSGSGSSPESGESSEHANARSRQAEKREAAKAAAEAWMEWFNRTFTRSFRVTQELSKQVGALLRQGYSEKPDMRGVALYLGSRWGEDEKMAQYLVPSSILRPTKFAERLDLAKEWSPHFWGSP